MVGAKPIQPSLFCRKIEAFHTPTRGMTRAKTTETASANRDFPFFQATQGGRQKRHLSLFGFWVSNDELETEGKLCPKRKDFKVEFLVVLGKTGLGLNGYAVANFRRPIFWRATNAIENNKRTLAALVVPAGASKEVCNDFESLRAVGLNLIRAAAIPCRRFFLRIAIKTVQTIASQPAGQG